MINIKNIIKVLLIAMFICVYSLCTAPLSFAADGMPWVGGQSLVVGGTFAKAVGAKKTGDEMVAAGFEQMREDGNKKTSKEKNSTPAVSTIPSTNDAQDYTFCGDSQGVFSELIRTGQKIFNRLRDLIYVVAGFGIIAVAVGGFFGNMNWKWLGAIVISLVVIASAGELVVLLTGCEQYGSNLITNTLEAPTEMKKVVKFGGSSLASAKQFEKVGKIIREEKERRYVVPSAPGKRFANDTKVTDMLYQCYALAENGEDFAELLERIKARYDEIIQGLGL